MAQRSDSPQHYFPTYQKYEDSFEKTYNNRIQKAKKSHDKYNF